MGIICERIGLGAGGQTADSLPVGSRPARSKGGFVGAGFWLLCVAADGDCGFLCPFGFFLYRTALYCPLGLGAWPPRYRGGSSLFFCWVHCAFQTEDSASFSARAFFSFSFSFRYTFGSQRRFLWSTTRRSCSWDLDEVRHPRQGPLFRRHSHVSLAWMK